VTEKSWQDIYAEKVSSAEDAISHIRNSQTIFVGSGAGEPLLLTDTLAKMASQFWGLQIIHLTSVQAESKLARPELVEHIRYNTFCIGRGRSFVDTAAAYIPINIVELPSAMASGIVPIDVALVQVTPPNAIGICSLGVSVDATKAALENADLVIAQVNENMPVTMGDSLVSVENIDFLVKGDAVLVEVSPPELDAISLTIGDYIAGLISDGMVLHIDSGPIASATMRYLDTKKDLGIHTDILTDDILRLIETRAVTNRLKQINKGKTLATMVLGSEKLYKEVDRNPYIELYPIERVNDPFVIARNDNMVSIHAVHEVELTGLARAESAQVSQIQNLPSSLDFINGASRSKNGLNIVALPSTTPDGSRSRIVAHSTARGIGLSRSRIHYVVTEFGAVHIYGLSIRERAIALISIAHPKFREQLLEEAKKLHYVDEKQVIPPMSGCVYPRQYESCNTFKECLQVFFRPIRLSDARRMQRLFYSLSPEAIRMRYHGSVKVLTDEMAQKLVAVDYSKDMAIVGLIGSSKNPQLIAECRYSYDPSCNMGDFSIVVGAKYRGMGIGKFLSNYLSKIAFSKGLSGLYAEVIQQNDNTITLLEKAWPTAVRSFASGICTFTLRFPEEDVKRPKDSIIVYSRRFGDFSYGEDHPFDTGRARLAMQSIREQGYLDEPWIRIEEPRMVRKERLVASHDPVFIDILEEANSGEWQDKFLQFGLGLEDCPIRQGLFDHVLLSISATITCVNLIVEENANVVFNPCGGFHHAGRSFAEGFCYVNDVIVAIDMLLARGFRVAYIDIDAHHGNGVQDAYYADDRVLFVSLHESGKTLYPWSGFETENGQELGKGYTVNAPLPEQTDDEAFEYIFDRVVTPAVERFGPTVVVATIGTDMHKADPLSHLSLTNNGMVTAMQKIRSYCHHLLLLGGGGYETKSLTNAWCRMWATANRIETLPDYMMLVGGAFLGGEGLQGTDIVDMQYRVSGDTKTAIMKELDRIALFHEENTLPLIRGSH